MSDLLLPLACADSLSAVRMACYIQQDYIPKQVLALRSLWV
jgi:hypothetical protein